jgi:hypothetical protein
VVLAALAAAARALPDDLYLQPIPSKVVAFRAVIRQSHSPAVSEGEAPSKVLSRRDGLQVFRSHACTDPAKMVKREAVGDRPAHELVDGAVC